MFHAGQIIRLVILQRVGTQQRAVRLMASFLYISGLHRSKIDEFTLNALRTRQSLVKGERLVRHEMRAVLPIISPLMTVSGMISYMMGNIDVFRVCVAMSEKSQQHLKDFPGGPPPQY